MPQPKYESISQDGVDRVTFEQPPLEITFGHFRESRYPEKHFTMVTAKVLAPDSKHSGFTYTIAPVVDDPEKQMALADSIVNLVLAHETILNNP